jgi:DNA-binding transcriptional LysR family regulator
MGAAGGTRLGRLDWGDLRVLVAVAEEGSLAAAARALGVNHTTVLRRVNAFEARAGVRLFDRLPAGYAPTAAGEELLAAARAVAATVTELERRLAGADARPEGTVRLTTTDTLMASVLPPVLAGFAAAHPGIAVEVSTAGALADLERRDADLALRASPEAPGGLVGRRLAAVAFGVYAAPERLRGAPLAGPAELASHPWVAPGEALANTAAARWLRREHPGIRPALLCDSFVAMRDAAAAGAGLAALPCYLGDTSPALRRALPEPVPALQGELWLLVHPDLRGVARVRALAEAVAAALGRGEGRMLVEGKRPAPPG